MDGIWTIGELAERAAAALAADGSAQVSGRVRDLPNERLIRWYTTIGLVDPPLGRRGRTALYGPRHLLQLVAVKRRQAAGRSIAEIQVELAAATDATLEQIASLPSPATPSRPATASGRMPARHRMVRRDRQSGSGVATADHASPDHLSGITGPPPAAEPDDHIAAQTGAEAGGGEPASPPDAAGTTADTSVASAPTPRGDEPTAHPNSEGGSADPAASDTTDRADRPAAQTDFTGEPADPADAADPADGARSAVGVGEPGRGNFWSARPDVSYSQAAVADDYGGHSPSVVHGVRLTPGLTLLLDVPTLSGDDLAAIEAAARPLLDELRRRGLLTPAESPVFLPADHSRRSQ